MKTLLGSKPQLRQARRDTLLSIRSIKKGVISYGRYQWLLVTVSFDMLIDSCLYIIMCTDYVGDLFKELMKSLENDSVFDCSDIKPPSPLCSDFHHPVKVEAIKEHQSRFSSLTLKY